VLGRVLAWRLVAAADMPTYEAEPQMDPPTVGLQTFFTALGRTRPHILYLIEMRARCCHHCFSSNTCSVRQSSIPKVCPGL
jgi:hypothetical protein